ncbi:MAG: acyl carrier protein [Chloroflexota bacterium]
MKTQNIRHAQDIRSRLTTIIAEEAELKEDEVSTLQSFEDAIDSLTLLVIVADIEREIGVKVPDEQISQLSTLDEAVMLVTKLLDGQLSWVNDPVSHETIPGD